MDPMGMISPFLFAISKQIDAEDTELDGCTFKGSDEDRKDR